MALLEDSSLNVVSRCYGGTGGDVWDDGIHFDGVREITLRFARLIDSIIVVYDKKGKHIQTPRHGGDGGGDPKTITLDYPREYLTKVSGYFGEADWKENEPVMIRSLKFETYFKKTYGPYGEEKDTPFAFTVNAGEKIVGFFGRSGRCMDAIGCHVTRA